MRRGQQHVRNLGKIYRGDGTAPIVTCRPQEQVNLARDEFLEDQQIKRLQG